MSNNVYAAYSKNEKIRLESSSGAIFSLLAESVLNVNGIIYGVTLSMDCRVAEYLRVDNKKELPRLRGSKYLQAKVGDTYQHVKTDLELGAIVLFSGTECQINGLKNFLGKDYENLYCIDVICHGVPSPKLWRKYVDYVEKQENSKLISVNFRCKKNGWIDFGIKRIDANHKAMFISKDDDPYMLMFLRDYCLRPSCYECLAKQNKASDLTIADFWGIDMLLPEMNDGKGCSLVIVRTEKGQGLFNSIISNIILKTVSYEDGVKANPAEYSSARRPKERNRFYKDMNIMKFDELKAKYAGTIRISIKNKLKSFFKKIFIIKSKSNVGGGGKR